ncbi:endonuclease VII domain-containing protein [Modestobacter sp. SYSU DS0290]
MKRCPDCGEEKPTSEFGRNRALPDGLSFYCLACNRRRNGAWYRTSRAAVGKTVRDHSWVPEGSRWCPGCRQAVTHEQFSRNSRQRSGFGSRCLRCHRRSSNDAYWTRRYGLTRADVAALRAGQADACAICGAAAPEHLDHDHQTGRVRALLCQRCNQGLGLLQDDPSVLRAAADYVEEHRDSSVAAATGQFSGVSPDNGCSPGYVRWLAMRTSA